MPIKVAMHELIGPETDPHTDLAAFKRARMDLQATWMRLLVSSEASQYFRTK